MDVTRLCVARKCGNIFARFLVEEVSILTGLM